MTAAAFPLIRERESFMPTDIDVERLERYFDLFGSAFPRRDQFQWARVYLRGLLESSPRKNAETIARHLPAALAARGRNPVQALQHFLNQSTWDEQELLARYRQHVARPLLESNGTFVVDEVAFVKRGQHSVGVQRQFSHALGRKANCQVAVIAEFVSDAAYLPLDVQLYLPGRWLTAPARLDRAGVPEALRARRPRGEVALDLLRRLAVDTVAGHSILVRTPQNSMHPLLDELLHQQLPFLAAVTAEFPVVALDEVSELSATRALPQCIATATGRSVRSAGELSPCVSARTGALFGVPVHAAEAAAERPHCANTLGLWLFFQRSDTGAWNTYLGALPPTATPAQVQHHLTLGLRAAAQRSQLITTHGWDHFEGRSWRGFHHHATLVLLAHGAQFFQS